MYFTRCTCTWKIIKYIKIVKIDQCINHKFSIFKYDIQLWYLNTNKILKYIHTKCILPKTLSGTPDTVWCPPSCPPLSKTCQSGDDPYVRSQSRGWPGRRRSVTAWLPSGLAGAIRSLSTAPASPSLLFVILYIVSLCSRPNVQVSTSYSQPQTSGLQWEDAISNDCSSLNM